MSSPYGDVAQLARAPALQAGGRGFDSHRLHFLFGLILPSIALNRGVVFEIRSERSAKIEMIG